MRRWLALLALGSMAVLAGHARAEPDEATKLVARELMARGRAQREAKDFQAALASFSKAHAIMHVPTTLLEAARARVDVGLLCEARQLLGELSELPPYPNEPPAFVPARSAAEALNASLTVRIPSLSIDLSGSPQPSATRLWIDGTLRPDCVTSCRMNPGVHLVTACSPSARADEQLQLVEGESQALELVFSPLVGAPKAASFDPGRATTPLPHQAPRAAASRAGWQVRGWTWAWSGVALAGVGAGAVLGLSAVSQRDDLRERCAPRCPPAEVDAVRRRSVYSNLAFGIGATAAALAVVSYVF